MNGDCRPGGVRRSEIVGNDALVAAGILVGNVVEQELRCHLIGASIRRATERHHLTALVDDIVLLPQTSHGR